MTTPRIEIDLDKIRQNTRVLVSDLAARRMSVTGVTKAVCGCPAVAGAMLAGGATGLADARLANIQRLRRAGLTCPITMIRPPMLSEVGQIVGICETSYNTEHATLAALSKIAVQRDVIHNVVLLVEMGDMRDGIPPAQLGRLAAFVCDTPGLALTGIAANFACLGDIAPDAAAMATLSDLANDVEGAFGPLLDTVSGGASVNLSWALGQGPTGRINNLRLGEAILLGLDPTSERPIPGLHTDAFTLVAEVIEAKSKPQSQPAPMMADQKPRPRLIAGADGRTRAVLAVGHQDTDPERLGFAAGLRFLGATSDHLVVDGADMRLRVGAEIRMRLHYKALMRAMATSTVAKRVHSSPRVKQDTTKSYDRPYPALVACGQDQTDAAPDSGADMTASNPRRPPCLSTT